MTLFIAFIPIYFYLDASFENQTIKDKIDLKNYANLVVTKIENFKKENSELFFYPRSNIFTSAIIGEKNEVIFSLLKNEIHFESEFFKTKDEFCYKEYLNENILKAKNLIVCKDIDNSQVIYNAIILLLTISFFLFLSSINICGENARTSSISFSKQQPRINPK